MKTFHKNEDLSLTLTIDKSFRGILRGFAHDESEGCILSGELVLEVYRKTKIRSLETTFVGEVGVHFKTTNSVGVPTSDGTETRTIHRKTTVHFNETMINNGSSISIKSTSIDPGVYKFSFSYAIPATLPHSFKSRYGSVRYDLGATATRTMFNNDIHIFRPIMLRRCLMDDIDPIAPAAQIVSGTANPDIVKYSATAPSMVYCEGGMLTLGLDVELLNPERFVVRMVTCGLQEKVFYRTTGRKSLTNQKMNYSEASFPLGYSTFFPSRHVEYNPHELQSYNAMFRLYPRVHSDNKSNLIVVQHYLVIQMLIDDKEVASKKRKSSNDSTSSLTNNGTGRSILSHLSMKQQDTGLSRSLPTATSAININTNQQHHHRHTGSLTPPMSRSPSPTELSMSSTSEGSNNSSSTSLAMAIEQLEPFQTIVKVTSRKLTEEPESTEQHNAAQSRSTGPPSPPQGRHESFRQHIGHSLTMHHHFNPLKFLKDVGSDGTYECRLVMPIIVTSREDYREGNVPARPDYQSTVDHPPSYRASIQTLPPVPLYPSKQDDDMTRRQNIYT